MSRGKEILHRLRQESFNQQTEKKLSDHPILHSAEKGTLSLKQRRAFAQEQYFIQLSDAISFASLAGYTNFNPLSLTNAQVPKSMDGKNDLTEEKNVPDLFQFLLKGEIYASSLLLDYAKHLNLDELALSSYNPSAKGQAYPSYWARLALSNKRGAGAAACAVNFPAWGEMCRRLYDSLQTYELGYGYSDVENNDALAFIKFFATPIDNLDEMAIAILEQENVTYEEVVDHVRLLQAYEVYFWDAVYEVGG